MKPITYLAGDATRPKTMGNRIIVHICNNSNKWGAGFVLSVSSRWKAPELAYRSLSAHTLGVVQFVEVASDIIVANMIAQHGIGRGPDGSIPLRYDALAKCLIEVGKRALEYKASVHMPRIGCGLAGGTWDKVKPLIEMGLCAFEVPVFVYDLPAHGAKESS